LWTETALLLDKAGKPPEKQAPAVRANAKKKDTQADFETAPYFGLVLTYF